jgi:hypothetical protein
MDKVKGFFQVIIVILCIVFIWYGGEWLYDKVWLWFQKVHTRDIYENQLTQKRFQITEAHLGEYFIDSLQVKSSFIEKHGEDSIRSIYTNEIYILNDIFKHALKYESWLKNMNYYLSEYYQNNSYVSSHDSERRKRILEAFHLQDFSTNPNDAKSRINEYSNRIESSGIAVYNDQANIINQLSKRELDELKKEIVLEMNDWNRHDTYFRCNDYSEFNGKYNKYGWLNADVIDSKLYKKIN